MLLAHVLGTVTATIKHPSLEGWRLLAVQAYATDGATPDGEPVLAIDRLGARGGDRVILTSDGKLTQQWTGTETTPVRWTVLGIVDA